jgi:hypothetical protein
MGRLDTMKIGQVFFLYSVLIGLIFSACGVYSFSGSGIPSHIKTVAVPPFGNQTGEYGIRENLTDALIERLMTDGRLKVESKEAADSIISGQVVDYKHQAYSYDKSENVQEYIVRIYVDVSYEDVKKRKVVWQEENMEGWGTYDVQGDTVEVEEKGRERAIAKLAEDIVNRTLAGW